MLKNHRFIYSFKNYKRGLVNPNPKSFEHIHNCSIILLLDQFVLLDFFFVPCFDSCSLFPFDFASCF